MTRSHPFLLAAALVVLPLSTVSATQYVPCDGCDYSTMSNAALTRGVGRYVVGNALQDQVYGFRVYLASRPMLTAANQPAAVQRRFVDETVLDPAEVDAFKALASFYQQAPVGYRKHYELTIVPADQPVTLGHDEVSSVGVPPINPAFAALGVTAPGSGGTVHYDVPGTNVYSVINSGPVQNQFLSWVGNKASCQITSALTNMAKAAGVLHLADISALPAVSFTVTFEDGSRIGAYVDTAQAPAQLKVNPGSGVDSHGNNVPADRDAVAGAGKQNYDYSRAGGNGGDLVNMQGQIRGFGIDVPATTAFACTRIAGGAIHCIPVGTRGY